MNSRPDIDELAVRVAAWDLPGHPVDNEVQLGAGEFAALRTHCFGNNLGGLLVAAVEDGLIAIEADDQASLHEALGVRLISDLRVEAECVGVVEMLERHGIGSVVLKGLATAHLDYTNPSFRSTNDVDLLVRPPDLLGAVHCLERAGYRRDLPERRPGFDRRFAKDVTMYGPNGVEIDLHRTLVGGPFGATIDLDELWEHQEPLVVENLPDRSALDPVGRLVQSCLVAVVGDRNPSLATLRDIGLLVSRADLDWSEVVRRAGRWRLDSVVIDGVARATSLLRIAPTLPDLNPDRSIDRWRRLYDAGGGSNTSKVLGTTLGLAWRQRAQFLLGVIRPGSAYRASRRSSLRSPEWRTGASELAALLYQRRRR